LATVVRLTDRGVEVGKLVGSALSEMAQEWQAVIREENGLPFRHMMCCPSSLASAEP
jgi:hypothetical protein